jgi:hypothetical protein
MAHQESVNFTRTLPSFSNCPDDERLPSPHVTRRKDLGTLVA